MRPAAAWLGDYGRLLWGSLYWNSRKSAFRVRGARGAAPCQHPSDSGKGGRTACEACVGWRSASRFQRMCPLMAISSDGRRLCSVDAGDVRPFWGRAVLVYLGSAAAVVLVAVVGVFTGLRAIGYRVPFYAVAWPPAWHRIHQAQADYFYRMAAAAFSAGDVRQGFLALNQVYALDPGNVSAAMLLAQFTQVANPEYSDTIYARLLVQRRGDTEETAQAWFRALLLRGDFLSMGRLSEKMLREGAVHAPAWTQGVLFAERMTGDTGNVDRLLAEPGKTPAASRSVLSLARDIRTGNREDRRKRADCGDNPWRHEPAKDTRAVAEVGEALKLDACSALDWRVLERKEIGFILDQGASAPVVTLVAAHLIRYPSAECAGFAFEQLALKPLPATAENAGAHAALLCMAGVNGLGERMKQEAALMGWVAEGKSAGWEHIRDFFESPAPAKNPAAFLPTLHQLPLEVVYALAAHYHDAAQQGGDPASPGKTPAGDRG